MFTVSHQITNTRVADLLCCAFESGSKYWMEAAKPTVRTTKARRGELAKSLGLDKHFYDTYYAILPLVSGLGVTVTSEEAAIDEERDYVLNRAACDRGLSLMLSEFPTYFGQFIAGHEDGECGDVFLQLALFGKVVFG